MASCGCTVWNPCGCVLGLESKVYGYLPEGVYKRKRRANKAIGCVSLLQWYLRATSNRILFRQKSKISKATTVIDAERKTIDG